MAILQVLQRQRSSIRNGTPNEVPFRRSYCGDACAWADGGPYKGR